MVTKCLLPWLLRVGYHGKAKILLSWLLRSKRFYLGNQMFVTMVIKSWLSSSPRVGYHGYWLLRIGYHGKAKILLSWLLRSKKFYLGN